MSVTFSLGVIGMIAAAACVVAYFWGYVLKSKGFRLLSVLSLFATAVALAQLAVMLTGIGDEANALMAMAFLVISGLAQAVMAVRGRAPREGQRTRESDGLGA